MVIACSRCGKQSHTKPEIAALEKMPSSSKQLRVGHHDEMYSSRSFARLELVRAVVNSWTRCFFVG